MHDQLKAVSLLFKNKLIYPVLIIGIIDLVILGFAIYAGNTTYQLFQKLTTVKGEVQQSQNAVTLINNNKGRVEAEIDELNAILEKAIPDDESYFTVISALEQLAIRTGVDISSYNIDLNQTTSDKLTLNVEVTGEEQALETFFKEYLYTGGRLITNVGLRLNAGLNNKVSFSMNFYHKKFTDSGQGNSSIINENDVAAVREIGTQL